MNKNRKIKRGVTAGIAAGMSFLLGALPVCAADTSVSKDETVYDQCRCHPEARNRSLSPTG